MSYTQRITIRRPKPKRSLWGFGDGPVTSPSDPSLDTPGGQVIAGTVPPTRVACEDLPADSPFRGPNGPCPAAPSGSIMDWLRDTFGVGTPAAVVTVPATVGAPAAAPAAPVDSGPPVVLIAAAIAVGYYLYAKRKKKRSA
jgi:hypothetical protein